MKVKCPKCGYEWDYKGKRDRATCPSCGYPVKVDLQSTQSTETPKYYIVLVKVRKEQLEKVKEALNEVLEERDNVG